MNDMEIIDWIIRHAQKIEMKANMCFVWWIDDELELQVSGGHVSDLYKIIEIAATENKKLKNKGDFKR